MIKYVESYIGLKRLYKDRQKAAHDKEWAEIL